MEFVSHLFGELLAALGRILLSISAALVLEELTWGGLARLVLTPPSRPRQEIRKK